MYALIQYHCRFHQSSLSQFNDLQLSLWRWYSRKMKSILFCIRILTSKAQDMFPLFRGSCMFSSTSYLLFFATTVRVQMQWHNCEIYSQIGHRTIKILWHLILSFFFIAFIFFQIFWWNVTWTSQGSPFYFSWGENSTKSPEQWKIKLWATTCSFGMCRGRNFKVYSLSLSTIPTEKGFEILHFLPCNPWANKKHTHWLL